MPRVVLPRECKFCGESRVEALVPNPRQPQGVERTCRVCNNERMRTRFNANPTNRERRLAYYADNADRAREVARQWFQDNPERAAASRRAYVENNEELTIERQRMWREANRDTIRAKKKKFAQENREAIASYQAEYHKQRPEIRLAAQVVRRGRKNQAPKCAPACRPANAREIIAHLGPRDTASCLMCADPAEHLDHVVPLARSGCSCLFNLRWLCAACNLAKGPKLDSEWIL